jgi:hypothetical protein
MVSAINSDEFLLGSQMLVPLMIVLLVLILKTDTMTQSALSDTSMNSKSTVAPTRLYTAHNRESNHHIPIPLIVLSSQAFTLNTDFIETPRLHTTRLFRAAVHSFDFNRHYQYRGSVAVLFGTQLNPQFGNSSGSQISFNVGSGVKETSWYSVLDTIFTSSPA